MVSCDPALPSHFPLKSHLEEAEVGRDSLSPILWRFFSSRERLFTSSGSSGHHDLTSSCLLLNLVRLCAGEASGRWMWSCCRRTRQRAGRRGTARISTRSDQCHELIKCSTCAFLPFKHDLRSIHYPRVHYSGTYSLLIRTQGLNLG